ncbi:ADP compounds hydrolase NudE [Thiothrix subterranea]|uniref:ADP compounds hydrolase NudE n=1 Tax=Thiothrix subterranea TaxID=2735563 RepID=UPI00192B638B|nr:ADP compounds hydrolase NudE [Thiothrix subterranea]QQZ29533.1 ADP compounds hydrolase NudE [Thiothrix subterranea]
MQKPPTIHAIHPVTSSRLFHVEEIHLEFSNGERRTYERLANLGNGAVLIVPLLDDDTLLLIREYSAGTGRYELGFPKGKVERGEDVLDAANREIMEEVGYGARDLHVLRRVSLSPGYMQHSTHLILARDLYPQRTEGDEPEPLEVVPWKLSDAADLLLQDDFTEGRSLLALYLAQDWLGKHHS